MKAVVYSQYGTPANLRVREVERPVPKDDEVLVRVRAASINAWDWDLVRGRPYMARLEFGIRAPKRPILGADIAGRVEAIGKDVRDFSPGDEVFGDVSGSGWGGFAEYVTARERAVAVKPEGLSFEQAAAIPQAAGLAYQALRKATLHERSRVLIVGAGGGAGSFTVRMAKARGATVTAVDRGDKFDMLRSIGADDVVDYRHEDFTRRGQEYDLIVDMVMQHSLFAYDGILAANGRLVVVGGATGRILQTVALGPVLSRVKGKRFGLLMYKVSRGDMEAVGRMVASGQISAAIDRAYSLDEVPEAMRYFGEGNAKGKVIISVAE